MNRLWRGTTCGVAALGLVGLFAGSAPAEGAEKTPAARAARPAETVELDLPAGRKQLQIEGEQIGSAAKPRELQFAGSVVITLADGVRVHTERSRVALVMLSTGEGRVLVEPQPGGSMDVLVPAGVGVAQESGRAFLDPSTGTRRMEPTSVTLSNGLRLQTRQARVALTVARPSSSSAGHLLVVPLPARPASK